ncbi:uncharacterized protein SCHCODRAFT_02511733 [Schizophyllum commune H4-8]|uniref:uncharacterized protein n=1 Tax=Schizophyllum commune (strain H4-8 / FGSC 9210) TaxID=578458 RepID=UPI00215FDB3E|nr:uncharacterized protein SCHCODRAFT_02511733 [Schizophyllum commune H4-8]KAI5889406.1 hypothetical protein SCHCODRAFT_02511733 [Schizophyllum commune H4-8]
MGPPLSLLAASVRMKHHPYTPSLAHIILIHNLCMSLPIYILIIHLSCAVLLSNVHTLPCRNPIYTSSGAYNLPSCHTSP